MIKPGVTQELRARVRENLASDVRRRRLATVAVLLAVMAAGLYFLIR